MVRIRAGVGEGRYRILVRVVSGKVRSAASGYGLVVEIQSEAVNRIIPA